MTIGGNVVIRNGNRLDYCWRETIKSLLPVCDVVVVCDGESDDGTQQDIREWLKTEPKIKLCVWKWKDPKGDIDFFVDWLNYCRDHIHTDWHLQLDADEILHENSYDEVREFVKHGRRSAICTRYNFWADHKHTIPDGFCLGKMVRRLAPTNVWMPSDGVHAKGNDITTIECKSNIEIFHYGFLRKKPAFFEKEKLLQRYFFNSYDPRLDDFEKFDGNWMLIKTIADWILKLEPFTGQHPKIIQRWLIERGYL